MDAATLIKNKQGTLIDVRTPAEFMGGHAEGAINIPLQEVAERIEELRGFDAPLVLCCASGARSGAATQYLNQQGLESVNAGSWLDVHYLQTL
ncbi:rhodanese-like domain-containing protein [bacterium]|nr:rhodanese-like domain-containing protein [bacterium]